ncbi:hypothetical protein [Streptomyces sp. SJL17-1]|uniref:hypothetical protein n=1 Tax=Streptomyces sp. SJL17-1 TaxID=2967223 RepID=UPI00296677A3|nr:hypothetical protein [Streptomyces sp. SJL17-1]
MADKNDRWNHPHWHLLILVPLLVFLIIEDDVITRSLLAGGSSQVLCSTDATG